MSDLESTSPEPKRSKGSGAVRPRLGADPSETRNSTDPGDATSRNFRYQHAYGVMLLVSAMRGLRPYAAIWCEQHEDFLAQRQDGSFDGYQIKTSRPELGAWTLKDGELTKSIGRFVDLVAESTASATSTSYQTPSSTKSHLLTRMTSAEGAAPVCSCSMFAAAGRGPT